VVAADVAVVSVPDVRDYQRINAELVQQLDEGHRRLRLAGAEGQRLLAAGLAGRWEAVVEVVGRAGPELAAGLDAPNLVVVALGAADDGAGSRLRAGLVVIVGDVGAAAGYAQEGGDLVVGGVAGPRAGLNQRGGNLVLGGRVGMLAAERQRGGRVYALGSTLGPHAGFGRRGGRLIPLATLDDAATLPGEDGDALRSVLARASAWISG
jgi:glutamate synthase domain-containing protein 3